MTEARSTVADLVTRGLDRREARWLVEEFADQQGATTAELESALARRLSGEPLQYVIGHWPFRSLDLCVDSRVLIPRPETEELVEVALAELDRGDFDAAVIVDLGCGSGAVGLALLDELRTRGVKAALTALDASADALEVARVNARRHGLTNVTFLHSTWYEELDRSLAGRVNLIVANPPYVSVAEFATADPVLGYEPRGALVADDEDNVAGFADVAHVIGGAPPWLAAGGALVCEHGEGHREAALAAAARAGLRDGRDLDDLSGRARILVARA